MLLLIYIVYPAIPQMMIHCTEFRHRTHSTLKGLEILIDPCLIEL